jgi:transposase
MDFRLPVREFETRYRKEKNARAKTRLHILLLRRQKYTQQEIAAMVHVTQGTISNVCRRFLASGWSSVYDKPRSGKPARLTIFQKEALRERLAHEYVDDKNRRGWQTKDVRNLIKQEFGKTLSPWQTRRVMYGFKMSWKVPRPQHKKRDQTAVDNFKKSSRGRRCHWQMNTPSFA